MLFKQIMLFFAKKMLHFKLLIICILIDRKKFFFKK
jgi:hypothetical protein